MIKIYLNYIYYTAVYFSCLPICAIIFYSRKKLNNKAINKEELYISTK